MDMVFPQKRQRDNREWNQLGFWRDPDLHQIVDGKDLSLITSFAFGAVAFSILEELMQLPVDGFGVKSCQQQIGCLLHPLETDRLLDANRFMSFDHHRVLLSNFTRGTMTSSMATPP